MVLVTTAEHLDRSDLEYDVAVLGAGAAGLVAAIRAAECGARVVLVEKNRRPGVKILMSGGTRCNVTNARGLRRLEAVSGPIDPAFDPALRRGTPRDPGRLRLGRLVPRSCVAEARRRPDRPAVRGRRGAVEDRGQRQGLPRFGSGRRRPGSPNASPGTIGRGASPAQSGAVGRTAERSRRKSGRLPDRPGRGLDRGPAGDPGRGWEVVPGVRDDGRRLRDRPFVRP